MSRIFTFKNDVDTDQILASQYLLLPNIDEMKGHAFESLSDTFASEVKPGDLIVAGDNFGCGSSREQAPAVLKALGVQATNAIGFARIYYRNSNNIGLPVLVSPELSDAVKEGDEASLDLTAGTVTVGEKTFTCTKLPPYMQRILNAGGLIAFLNEDAE